MISSTTTPRQGHLEQPISRDGSIARGLLGRDALLQTLERAVTRRITVISAPAGSGKTSLLRAWADSTTLKKVRHIAFVSVDRDEHDAQLFWAAVLVALRRPAASIHPEIQPATLAGVDSEQLVGMVRSELSESVEPVVLIVDDLHELKSAEALAQLERLVAALPSSARVVLSSRRDPPIRLHRLRLEDEVAEIRASDLRFTQHEARELLIGSGVSLSEGGVAALYERTEGWAAGLRLAVISLARHPDPERFVAEFSGTDRAIGEYLMAEMLERQPSDVQSMLLRTSIVDRLNGELADLLSGRAGSERTLLELEDANAFVVSLDAQRTWFRYHHLLTDFLRLELRRSLIHIQADEIPDLHRRAARWFADHGEAVEAVRHMLAAGDWPDAARLLADHLFSLTLDGQEGTIAALLRSFPAGASHDDPELALAHAAVELAQGRLEEATAPLALAESHAHSVPPARRRRLAVAIASLRLALARRSGRFTDVMDQVHLLDASTADESSDQIAMGSELRAVALMNLGIVETWSGRFDDAERHLSDGAALAQAIGRPYLEVACRTHQGFPSKTVSLATARERARQAVALAERYGLRDRPILAPALGWLGCFAVWTGEFDEAEHWLRRAWDVAEPTIDPAAAVLLHASTGMLHAARGEHQSTLQELAAAVRAESLLTGVHVFGPPIAGWLAATQARLGMTMEARATLTGFSEEDELVHGIRTARAAICIAEGDPTTALDLLQDVLDTPPPAGLPPYGLVEAHLHAGIAYLDLGDRTAAAAALEVAIAAAESERLIFPFAMIGAGDLLDALPRHATAHGALLADIADVLREVRPTSRFSAQVAVGRTSGAPLRLGPVWRDTFSAEALGAPAPRAEGEVLSPVEELSPSELRVLRYLPTNLTRPEIARELYLSLNTVNTHLRNIYSKLGARDRSSAVSRARELRILSTARHS